LVETYYDEGPLPQFGVVLLAILHLDLLVFSIFLLHEFLDFYELVDDLETGEVIVCFFVVREGVKRALERRSDGCSMG
jgi:hypothetical protein